MQKEEEKKNESKRQSSSTELILGKHQMFLQQAHGKMEKPVDFDNESLVDNGAAFSSTKNHLTTLWIQKLQ